MSGSKNSRKGTRKGRHIAEQHDQQHSKHGGASRTARRGFMAHVQENEAGAFGPKDRYLSVNL